MFGTLKLAVGFALAFAVFLGLATQWEGPTAAAAAGTERQVVFHIANKDEPVVITKVTLGNELVQAGRFVRPATSVPDQITPFQAGDDWIQNLTVYFLNRTWRTIVRASFHFSFPETGDGYTVPRREYNLILGRIPPEVAFDQKGRRLQQRPDSQPISFRRGQTMAIRLGDYMEQIKANIEPGIPLSVATKLNIDLGTVFFDDGMQWGGRFSAFDPRTLTWRRMEPNFFPGDMDRAWPGRPGWPDQQ